MVTKRKTELSKASGDIRRAFWRFMRALPMVTRVNWRNVVMPWRLVPMPVALALIALVALAMVLDAMACTRMDSAPISETVTPTVTPTVALPSTIGGQPIPAGLRCYEDETIFWVDVDTLACVPADNLARCGSDADCALVTGTDGAPIPAATPRPAPSASCADDAPPGYTWQGSSGDGFVCVPMSEFMGRIGEIIVTATDGRQGGTVTYHTAPCHAHDVALPPPFADVILCVESTAWAAAQ